MRETELDLDVLAQTESVFALSNGHIGLRGNLDEGEPHGLPGTYLNGVLRDAPAALRRGRLRLPRGRPDGRQRHQRQAHPAAGRRRAVRRALRRAASPRARARPARRACCAARSSGARRPGSAVRVRSHAAGLASPSARSPRSATRSSRSTADARIVVQSELVANEHVPARSAATRARPRRSRAPLRRRVARHATTCAPCSCTARSASGLRMAAGDGPRGRRARRARRPTPRAATDLGARDGRRRARAAARRCASSSSSPTAGRAQRSLPALRDQVDAALAGGAAHRLGRAARASSASTSTTSGTRADVEIEGDAELQQAVRFALFHVLQAGARAERRAIAGQGPDRARATTATPSGTPRRFVLPVLTYTAPEAAARRAALAPLDARPGRASARAQLGLAGRRVPVADDPRRGVLGLLAGRHRRVPHQRRHRRRRASATCDATGDERVRARGRRSSCWSRPRGCGARSATTTRDGALPHRRRHRARRVHRDRRQQRLHEPDGRSGTCAAAADAVRAPPATRPRALGVDDEEIARLARRRRRDRHPVRRGARRAPAVARASPHHAALGLRATPRPSDYPLLLHYPYFDLYRKQVVKQADLVLAHAPARRRVHRRGEGARLRLLRGAHRARLVAVGLRRRRSSRPRSATSSWPTTTSARPRSMDLRRPRAQHARRPAHRLAGRRLDRRRSPASAACATTAATLALRAAAARRASSAWRFRLMLPRAAAARRDRAAARRATSCVDGEPIELRHETRRSRSSTGSAAGASVARAGAPASPPSSPRIARPAGGGRAGPADRRRGAKVARSWSAAATGPTKDPPWTPPARGLLVRPRP